MIFQPKECIYEVNFFTDPKKNLLESIKRTDLPDCPFAYPFILIENLFSSYVFHTDGVCAIYTTTTYADDFTPLNDGKCFIFRVSYFSQSCWSRLLS